MEHPELTNLVNIFQRFASNAFQQRPAASEIEAVVWSAAYGRKTLFEAIKLGVISAREAAGAIAAEVHAWLVDRAGLKWDQQPADKDWTVLLDEVEKAVLACLADS